MERANNQFSASYWAETKISQRGNPFGEGFSFKELLENMEVKK